MTKKLKFIICLFDERNRMFLTEGETYKVIRIECSTDSFYEFTRNFKGAIYLEKFEGGLLTTYGTVRNIVDDYK